MKARKGPTRADSSSSWTFIVVKGGLSFFFDFWIGGGGCVELGALPQGKEHDTGGLAHAGHALSSLSPDGIKVENPPEKRKGSRGERKKVFRGSLGQIQKKKMGEKKKSLQA